MLEQPVRSRCLLLQLVCVSTLFAWMPWTPASGQVVVEDPYSRQFATVALDNDFFVFHTPPNQRPDDNYSHGLSIAVRNRNVTSRRLRRLCGASQACVWDVAIQQAMFTPEVDSAPPDPRLRPYAGTLGFSGTLRGASTTRMREIRMTIAVSGQPSGAQWVQHTLHRVADMRRVEGWSYQVPFEPAIEIAVAGGVSRQRDLGALAIGAIGVAEASVGNLRTGGLLRSEVELGTSLNHPWMLRPSDRRFSVNLFAGGAMDVRLHQIELDGALTRRSPSSPKETVVGSFRLGIRAKFGRLQLEHFVETVGRQVPEGRAQHRWGRVAVSYWARN